MLNLKKFVVTLRFSILTIFVSLFIFSMLTLIYITHIRFTENILRLSFDLMKQASITAEHEINDEFKIIKNKNQLAEKILQTGMLQDITIGSHGVLFVITENGNWISPPQPAPKNLSSIHELKSMPWLSQSFDIYDQTHQEKFTFFSNTKEYLATYQALTFPDGMNWLIGSVAPLSDFTREFEKTRLLALLIDSAILVLGILIVSILVSRVVHPLKKITREIRRIRNFDLVGDKRISSRIKEVSYIADALYSMKKGLRTFQKYVPATLVRQLIETGEDARIGGIKKPLAILFSDVRHFTAIAERMDPEELTPHLCEYFDALSCIITLHQGTIDKYIGDGIMAFWGAPQSIERPAFHAAKAALDCLMECKKLNRQWRAEKKPIFFTRFGIHLGEAIVGNFGSSERLNYTAMGDAINIANRLEGINKIYGTPIIVSHTIYEDIKQDFVLRMVDRVTLKGKNESNYIYELIANNITDVKYDLNEYNQLYVAGFSAYQEGLWDEAIRFFTECLLVHPKDTVAPVLIKRCLFLKQNTPKEWTGEWREAEQ